MPFGPGKYDDEATVARESAHATAVILMVFGGDRGTGFAIQAPLEYLVKLPELLRDVAAQIEADRR